MTTPTKVRLDKWLWAARFFKTRSQCAKAVDGGKVHLNGDRTKSGKLIGVGTVLSIRKGSFSMEITVVALNERRGTADQAKELYEETEASRKEREANKERREIDKLSAPETEGRPDKRQRRQLRRASGKEF